VQATIVLFKTLMAYNKTQLFHALLAAAHFVRVYRTKLLFLAMGLVVGKVTALGAIRTCLELYSRRLESLTRHTPAVAPVRGLAEDEWVVADSEASPLPVPVCPDCLNEPESGSGSEDGAGDKCLHERRAKPVGPWLGQLENTPTALPAVTGSSRIRRRALWVRRLQAHFGGRMEFVGNLLAGRWCDDLLSDQDHPQALLLKSWLAGGVTIVGGGRLRTSRASLPLVFFVANGPHGDQRVIYPEVVGRLQAYSWMRPRTQELLVALRSRARDWCNDQGLPAYLWPDAISGAVLSVWTEQRHEMEAEAVLRACGQFPLPSA